jgi:hypothetical protein
MPAGQFPFEKGNRKTSVRYKKWKAFWGFPFFISLKSSLVLSFKKEQPPRLERHPQP